MITFVVATHNEETFNKDIGTSKIYLDNKYKFIIQKGFTNIREAYNNALPLVTTPYVCFLHHDVWMPPEFEEQLIFSLNEINRLDPNHGVLGSAGAKYYNGDTLYLGSLFWANHIWGHVNLAPYKQFGIVDTLDELMLIMKTQDCQKFKEQLILNHFYGSEQCLAMSFLGKKNYALPLFCSHSSLPNNRPEKENEELLQCANYFKTLYPQLVPFSTTCMKVE
jgi:glycosyltransferase involved in cell wall biosynthesis